MALILNIQTSHIIPQYHCVYDNDFTTVNATKDTDKIKLWSGLYKAQPEERTMVNELDVMTNTFEMKVSPQLSLLDIATCGPSSGKSTLISLYTSANPRTQ